MKAARGAELDDDFAPGDHEPQAPQRLNDVPQALPLETQPRSWLPVWATTLMVIGLAWIGDVGGGTFAVVGSMILKPMGVPKLPGWQFHAPMLVAGSFLSWGWCLLAIWFLGCRMHRKSLSESLGLRNPGAAYLLGAVALGIIMAAVGALVSSKWGRMDTTMAKMGSTPMGIFWIGVMALPLGGLEEVYYRGFIFPRLKRGLECVFGQILPGAEKLLGGLGALGIIVVWFGLIHLQQLIGTGNVDWMSLGAVTCAGLVFTLQRWGTGSLLPSLITHVTYNTTLITASFIQISVQQAGGTP